MTLIVIKAIHYNNSVSVCNVVFLSSGLYRRYWILTSSAKRLVDLRSEAITTGVDFHHALKQIIDYSQQRE